MNLTNSFGIGISMKTITPFASLAGISLSGGVVRYFGKKNFPDKTTTAFFCFPLKVGINLFNRKGVYLEPQTGYSITSSKVGSEGAFCYGGSVGSVVNHHLDVSFVYENMTKYKTNFSRAGLRIACVF